MVSSWGWAGVPDDAPDGTADGAHLGVLLNSRTSPPSLYPAHLFRAPPPRFILPLPLTVFLRVTGTIDRLYGPPDQRRLNAEDQAAEPPATASYPPLVRCTVVSRTLPISPRRRH
ncbi:hypothetical protein DPEC_G00183810 [Dallia pectoralis]|uniref:Uncharacterized protein n=1 Tax=Dallia pectoralis TaxID=75939 RepID=A0ACC2GBB6_DALPE|nr:hypothetical protein DPEC_G00183810 [Dallia pectoralis]